MGRKRHWEKIERKRKWRWEDDYGSSPPPSPSPSSNPTAPPSFALPRSLWFSFGDSSFLHALRSTGLPSRFPWGRRSRSGGGLVMPLLAKHTPNGF
ncbi:hypothetical protein MUK42_06595 [Musa troglodytarum]|uniref:Uncharacterized protein n=1 Tax=Musa troglodytarum TaxID=320322 RepID=A0A9E7GB90_9LILI|nr:hypothetical protein MUK42_06595 [Musa troglodytarum]